jgi:hypothetical protein
LLIKIVKGYIKHRLHAKFALIFDIRWTEGTDHYIGVWASYNVADALHHDGKEHPVTTLLSIRPLLADGFEGMMTAKNHLCHLSCILDGYGKNKTKGIALLVSIVV